MASDTEQARARVHNGRSIADLVKDLRDDVRLMLRQEVALIKAETSEKLSRVLRNVVFVLVGAAIGYAALLFLLAAATYGIAVGLAAAGLGAEVFSWLAPLITGLIVGVIAAALVGKGIATLRRESLTPEKTVESLEESRRWIASETRQTRGR